jgi:hypothetical protein
MNVLLLDHDEDRHARVATALKMINPDCKLHAMGSLGEAEDALALYEKRYGLALVGPDLPENPISVVRFLRRLSPEINVAAYDAYGQYDEIRLQRILLAGANMAFDIRMAPLKIALLLRPLLAPLGITPKLSAIAA